MAPSEIMTPSSTRPEVVSPLSPISPHMGHSRTISMSSDRPSMTGSAIAGMYSMPNGITPEPNYIAASAASQIVTNDHDSQSDSWFDQHGIEPSGETAMVAPPALGAVNRFLDQLLFQFLAASKSVSLASLRPAIIEVLKPKLAKSAILGADQELNEYLGGGEDEELLVFHNNLEPTGQWDLELVWKRTRLRCMVYSSLGDMEEEDEDRYTQEGGLEIYDSGRFSQSYGVVSPAVAIFLTSILEFMGEQALIVAGQAAYNRLRAKLEKEEIDGSASMGEVADRVVVTELDMERVALDRTLGRLWRGWKKRVRSPNHSVSMNRSFSRESMRSRTQSRKGSLGDTAIPTVDEIPSRKGSATESMIHESAAGIALPMGDDDVREIEIPGLAHHSDDEADESEGESETEQMKMRPKSAIYSYRDVEEAESAETSTPVFLGDRGRQRSNSVPVPTISVFNFWRKQQAAQEVTADPVVDDDVEKDGEAEATHPEDTHGEEAAHTEDTRDEAAHTEDTQKEAAHTEETREEAVSEPKSENKGIIAGVIAGAAALGTAAVVGIAAAAKGTTPAQEEESGSEAEDAQIMTSSRVSVVGDRNPSVDHSVTPRPPSTRPVSVQSVRMVDIPASPTRSRQGSQGSSDYGSGRNSSLSRASSVNSPLDHSRAYNTVQRTATASPIARNASAHSQQKRSISEQKAASEITSHPRSITPVVIPERSPLRDTAVLAKSNGVPQAAEVEDESPVISANNLPLGQPQFVLAPAPAIRALRDQEPHVAHVNGDYQSPSLRTPESGVPPLTPLREMMEHAPDTSDEASSIAPSVETNDAVTTAPLYRSYEASKPADPPRSVPASSSSPRSKQAPRSSPTQSRRSDENTPRLQGSTKPDRVLHTSGSSTSSGSHKVRPIRTSEDSHRNGGGKSFDELIQSDQTIQYTLTPQNMWEIESPESPRTAIFPVAREGSRSRSHSDKSNKSVTRVTPLNSNPPPEVRNAFVSPSKPVKPMVRVPPNVANTSSRVRPNAPQARDARIERESNISDFADFIRSTGPPGVTLPTTGYRNQNGVRTNSVAARAVPLPVVSEPRSSSSSAVRRLQARDAVVPAHDYSSELIDFIRQGPPSEKTHDNPRIPRTVAPFRTTADSDQMSGAIGGRVSDLSRAGVRDSMASGSVTNENSMQSIHSSVNSQSALLNNNYKSAASKPTPPTKPNNAFVDEDAMPKRKQRRVRDPYAIDSSDEEDDDFDEAPIRKPRQRQEESLIDFLNNVPPPPPTQSDVFETPVKPVVKKSSASGLMGRFARQGPVDGNSKLSRKDSSAKGNKSTSNGIRVNVNSPQIPPPHIPISVKMPSVSSPTSSPAAVNGRYDRSGATSRTGEREIRDRDREREYYTSRLQERANGSARVQQKSYQPREAVVRPSRMGGGNGSSASDLADFLMNTPPPPGNGMNGINYGAEVDEKSGGFVRNVFGRRKKGMA